MNRKGFTLVELLAVIVILSGISLVVVSSISSSLGRQKDRECNEQKELAKNAAKIYFSLNEGEACVKVSTLKTNNYFSDSSQVDKLGDDSAIKLCPTKCCEVAGCAEKDKVYYAYLETSTSGCK